MRTECVLALAGTDVYRACVHTLGLCVGVGTDRRERVQSVCAHLGVCVLMLFCKRQIRGLLPQAVCARAESVSGPQVGVSISPDSTPVS